MLKDQFTPGRVVALLTPLVFAPAAGAISVAAAKYLPGVNVDAGQLQAIFIAGATVALGQGALWLKGWQDYEKRQALLPEGVSNDIRLEETAAPLSSVADDLPEASANGSIESGGVALADEDGLEDELLADGFDEELDDPDEDLLEDEDEELVDEGDLVTNGRN
jgi:hypothetical protein